MGLQPFWCIASIGAEQYESAASQQTRFDFASRRTNIRSEAPEGYQLMPLQMDSAYRDAKAKIVNENTKTVEKQVVKVFGELKGRAIFNGLFPDRAVVVAAKSRKKKA